MQTYTIVTIVTYAVKVTVVSVLLGLKCGFLFCTHTTSVTWNMKHANALVYDYFM